MRRLLAVLLVAAALSGCRQQEPIIERVPPDQYTPPSTTPPAP